MEYGQLQVHLEHLITIAGYNTIHPGCRRLAGISKYMPISKNKNKTTTTTTTTSSSSLLEVMKPCSSCKRKLEIEEDRSRAWKKMKLSTNNGVLIPRINTRIADSIITYAAPKLHKNNYVCKCPFKLTRRRQQQLSAELSFIMCMNIAALALQVPPHSIVQIKTGKLMTGYMSSFSWIDPDDETLELRRSNYLHFKLGSSPYYGDISIFVQHSIYQHLGQSSAVFDHENNIYFLNGTQYYLPSKQVTLSIAKHLVAYDHCLNHQFHVKDLLCCCPKSPCGKYVINAIIEHAVPVSQLALIIHEYWKVLTIRS